MHEYRALIIILLHLNISHAQLLCTWIMKVCLVTVGATASFKPLILELLTERFLVQLHRYSYTHLVIQYGKDAQPIFDMFMKAIPPDSEDLHGITVAGFEFVPDMSPYIQMVRKDAANGLEQGLIISHAGKGHLRLSMNIFFPELNAF